MRKGMYCFSCHEFTSPDCFTRPLPVECFCIDGIQFTEIRCFTLPRLSQVIPADYRLNQEGVDAARNHPQPSATRTSDWNCASEAVIAGWHLGFRQRHQGFQVFRRNTELRL
jgi:hypothetical protein